MLFNLRLFISFSRKFGLISGFILFIKIKLKQTNNLNIPELKHSFKLRPNTSDLQVFYQLFSEREYDNPIDFTPKVIIDAGANIGLTSIFYANKYPNAKIIAIEPDSENFEVLEHNTKNYPQIALLQNGLWYKDVFLNISDKFKGGKWAMVVEEASEKSENSINAISIDTILKQFNINKIDILKMDIESAEKEVLSYNYQNWLPKTKMLIVELHDRMKPGCSKAFFDAINSSLEDFTIKSNGENFIIYNNLQ